MTGPGSGHPTGGLDDTVHQRHRLGILTVASEADRVEVTYLKDLLELTAGNLSRHLAVLADAGLIEVEKGYHANRPKTWIRVTDRGRRALADEIAALRALVQLHEAARPALP